MNFENFITHLQSNHSSQQLLFTYFSYILVQTYRQFLFPNHTCVYAMKGKKGGNNDTEVLKGLTNKAMLLKNLCFLRQYHKQREGQREH